MPRIRGNDPMLHLSETFAAYASLTGGRLACFVPLTI